MSSGRATGFLDLSQKNLGKVAAALRSAEQRLGRAPTDQEMASELDLTVNDYHDMLSDVSIARLSDVEDIDSLAGDMEPAHEVADSLRASALSDAIKELPEKEQLMMSLYYVDNLNLKEIGLVLNVSESRVSQIHGQAIARLKNKLRDWM